MLCFACGELSLGFELMFLCKTLLDFQLHWFQVSTSSITYVIILTY
jgi:hypothetical protein